VIFSLSKLDNGDTLLNQATITANAVLLFHSEQLWEQEAQLVATINALPP
jgi:hypothetical protein